jgi:hypothetical protein
MIHRMKRFWGVALATLTLPGTGVLAERSLVYVGTYTGPKSKGIHAYRTDTTTGIVEELGLVAEIQNPSFLALHPNGRFLYAASEVGSADGKPGGSVIAYQIEPATGALRELGRSSTMGGGPCHLMVDRTGRHRYRRSWPRQPGQPPRTCRRRTSRPPTGGWNRTTGGSRCCRRG